jgi:hypothetical protein
VRGAATGRTRAVAVDVAGACAGFALLLAELRVAGLLAAAGAGFAAPPLGARLAAVSAAAGLTDAALGVLLPEAAVETFDPADFRPADAPSFGVFLALPFGSAIRDSDRTPRSGAFQGSF